MKKLEQSTMLNSELSSLLKLTVLFVLLVLVLVILNQIYEQKKGSPPSFNEQLITQTPPLPLQERFANIIVNAAVNTHKNSNQSITVPFRDPIIPDLLANSHSWVAIVIKPNTTLKKIFNELNIEPKTLASILSIDLANQHLTQLAKNHELRLKLNDKVLVELVYPIADKKTLIVTRENNHYSATISTATLEHRIKHVKGIVHESSLETLQRSGIPEKTLTELDQLFSWQLENNSPVQQDTQFNILYQEEVLGDKEISTGEILAAELITPEGKLYHAYRFTEPTGKTHHYNLEGASYEKPFLRYPMRYSKISSSFSLLGRYHPILHVVRPHLGIDLVAPVGTPVYSIADGKITYQARKGGYGNVVMIEHGKGYTSLYAHLLDFIPTQQVGSLVAKGERIGYVGESGLTTGAHCHYELKINGINYDPSTADLPTGKRLALKQKSLFYQEALRLQILLNNNQVVVATE